MTDSMNILQTLQYPSGLCAAARKDCSTGYDKVWIRDTIYQAMGFEAQGNMGRALRAYHALLDVLKKYEYKIERRSSPIRIYHVYSNMYNYNFYTFTFKCL